MARTEVNICFDHNIGSADEIFYSFPCDSKSNENFVGFEPN